MREQLALALGLAGRRAVSDTAVLQRLDSDSVGLRGGAAPAAFAALLAFAFARLVLF